MIFFDYHIPSIENVNLQKYNINNMGFLGISFFNNSIEDWAIAIGIILASFVAVKVSYWIIANVIKK